jgi:hypothetical protein
VNYDKPERIALIHDIGVNTLGTLGKSVNRLTNHLAKLS